MEQTRNVKTKTLLLCVMIFICAIVATKVLAAEYPVTDTAVKDIPAIRKPAYLESYEDPVFGTKVTRITGNPSAGIPNVNGIWAKIARHRYSKSAAWNCDQSLLYLAIHQGRPNRLFLDGENYAVRFARHNGSGRDMGWHPQRPDIMVYVRDNATDEGRSA
jgi:hypothetical protein